MEDIFKGVPTKKLSNEEIKKKVEGLRAEGMSWRTCQTILNIPQTTLRRVCQAVPDRAESVPDRAKDGNASPSESLHNDYVTREEIELILDEFKLLVERVIEEKSSRAISYFILNKLDSLLEGKIRALSKEDQSREGMEGTRGI